MGDVEEAADADEEVRFSISEDELLRQLAQALPTVVDKLTLRPEPEVPSDVANVG